MRATIKLKRPITNIDVDLDENSIEGYGLMKWIPCSDRYPDMDERVLVYTVAHEYHVWDCMSNRADNYFWEDETGLYHDKYEVNLWLPLPEPYDDFSQHMNPPEDE